MKTKKILLTALMALALMAGFSSCSTKQHAINQLQNLSDDLHNRSEYYTVEEWKDAATKFKKARENVSRHTYDAAERRKIGRLEGECAGYFVSGLKKNVLRNAKNVVGEIRGILEGITKSTADY